MADSTEGDTDILYLGLLVPALITFIAGMGIHSFIIGVNVTDWWKGRPVTPVDHIVTSLGISRMGTQCLAIIYLIMDTAFQIHLDTHVTVFVGSIYDFFIYANFWLTSLLSIVFCLKISNFHSRLFLYLRGMIAHRTSNLIAISVLLSIFNCLMLLMMSITEVMKNGTYNTTMQNLSMDCTIYMNYFYNYTLGIFIPLFFYCISSVLLFTSLYHHTTKMKMSSNVTINLGTYYSVMKFVSFTLIYNTIYVIGHFLGVYYYYFYCVLHLWIFIVLNFVTGLHSSYLIYRTAKLRSQMSKVLQNVTDYLLQMKNTETRKSLEVVAV
ncbi:hypothetical protein GDO78_014251 [Eleutherodactylus coqui]|uniref:Taste receptor type 2 n=1 Tax=Eleutherodactylus coqui TaxID=57060 RepID=A0A8J6JQC9_ELECQ|nr:hypothetical protein GDO78_014251 [Eleutherodactylus coqui]